MLRRGRLPGGGPAAWKPRKGDCRKADGQSVQGPGSDVGTQDPPPLGEATLVLTVFLHRVQWVWRCPLKPRLPWSPSALDQAGLWQGEGCPGPQDGGPAPQLAGSVTSLGGQSQSRSWLCFPGTRCELREPPDSKQMFCSRIGVGVWKLAPGCASLPPRANNAVKTGPAFRPPEPAPGWLGMGGEGGLGALEMSSGFSADSRQGREGRPQPA